MTKDPTYLDLAHCSAVPCREFLFGTDPMGRDIFSMIWYGGRLSLFIGVGSTVISTLLAILFGTVSGLAPKWLDALLMRLTEILLSVPNLLLVIFLQAVIGTPSAWSIACARTFYRTRAPCDAAGLQHHPHLRLIEMEKV